MDRSINLEIIRPSFAGDHGDPGTAKHANQWWREYGLAPGWATASSFEQQAKDGYRTIWSKNEARRGISPTNSVR
jgi:hypothetical protein